MQSLREISSSASTEAASGSIQRPNVAIQISDSIEQAKLGIEDLSVALAGDLAALSGIAPSQKAKDKAGAIAKKHPAVETVSNGITVIEK